MPLDAPAADDPRVCLHCGARTPPGKWRCGECQSRHGAARDGMLETIRANRAEASRERHGDDD